MTPPDPPLRAGGGRSGSASVAKDRGPAPRERRGVPAGARTIWPGRNAGSASASSGSAPAARSPLRPIPMRPGGRGARGARCVPGQWSTPYAHHKGASALRALLVRIGEGTGSRAVAATPIGRACEPAYTLRGAVATAAVSEPTNSRSAAGPPASATSIAVDPTMTPSAPAASAASACSGAEIAEADEQRQVGVRAHPLRAGRRRGRGPLARARHADHRDEVDEAARLSAGEGDALVGRRRRDQLHEVDAVLATGGRELARLVGRDVGDDQAVGARRRRVGAERAPP